MSWLCVLRLQENSCTRLLAAAVSMIVGLISTDVGVTNVKIADKSELVLDCKVQVLKFARHHLLSQGSFKSIRIIFLTREEGGCCFTANSAAIVELTSAAASEVFSVT